MAKKFDKSLGKQKAAQAGYEKRQARKAGKAKATSSTLDLYEHIQEKTRRDRSKVGLELDRSEAFDYAVALDEANDEEREQLRARLIGEFEDDEELPSEDDEELDSDAAFDESDEERFGVFFAVKTGKGPSTKPAKRQRNKPVNETLEIDLNEDDTAIFPNDEDDADDSEDDAEEEEYEELLEEAGDEVIDLVDVLDGKGGFNVDSDGEEDSNEKLSSSAPKASTKQADEEPEERDEDEEESDEDDVSQEMQMEIDIAPSDDEDVPEALDQLQDFVSTLDVTAKKRKAADEDGPGFDNTRAPARKRRPVAEKTEAGEENEFRARSAGSKLNLDDLLAPLEGQSSALQSLKKTAKILASSSSSKAKTLSAPLPHRAQERLDRQAAYEETKKEVDKWTDTMKRIREAEHLSFPLQAQSTGRVSNSELNAKFKPTTELESAVDALLKSAKMREEDILDTEDAMLKTNNLSVEEVAQRRSELRKMRELALRAELKARRANKIKSKTYRKIKRKEKERLAEKIDEGDEDDPEMRMKHELERARERATLRHKHTGKWARQMRHKEGLDQDSRRDIEEMLERGEKLRRRIAGAGSDEEEGEESEDDDDDLDVEVGIEKIKQSAFDELRKIHENDDGDDEENGESSKQKSKSVFEMKFMKDAMARQSAAARKDVDDFIKEMGGSLGGNGGSDDDADEEMQDADPSMGVVSSRTGGRVVFRPAAAAPNQPQSSKRPVAESDTSSVTLKSTDLPSPSPGSPIIKKRSELSKPQPSQAQDQDINPWLALDASKIKAIKKANEVVISKASKAADKSKNKLKKAVQKRAEEREKALEDATVEISMDNVMVLSSASTSAPKSNETGKGAALPPSTVNGKKTGGQQPPAPTAANGDDDDDDAEVNLELEAQEQLLTMKGKGKATASGLKAFEQRELVALAFAGDNVVQSFEEAKNREIASDAPREVDTTIPGWGSWGGTGTKKAPPKPGRIKKIAGIDPTTRADYNKKNIIISEKRDKKASKYLVKDLPYPYTSKAQFERAMERPLGVEWNTRVGFQRGTLPRVVKKPGVIIDPLEKLHS